MQSFVGLKMHAARPARKLAELDRADATVPLVLLEIDSLLVKPSAHCQEVERAADVNHTQRTGSGPA
jgi:hypothetical protein